MPEPSLSLFQPEVLDDSCGGMIEIVVEVLESFLKQGPADIDRLVAALAGGDLPSMRRAAHSLKGSCLTVGAETLAAACQRIESQADYEPVPVADLTHDALTREWDLLRVEIEAYAQTLGHANASG